MSRKTTLDDLLVTALVEQQIRAALLSSVIADECHHGFRFVTTLHDDTAAIVFVDADGVVEVYSSNVSEKEAIERTARLWDLHRRGPYFASFVEAIADEQKHQRTRRAAA